jgi:hypothetical protein
MRRRVRSSFSLMKNIRITINGTLFQNDPIKRRLFISSPLKRERYGGDLCIYEVLKILYVIRLSQCLFIDNL